jgi:hypothetical protein
MMSPTAPGSDKRSGQISDSAKPISHNTAATANDITSQNFQ